MKAAICPVCNGRGQVSGGFYNRGVDCPYWETSEVNPESCRSCGGKGWVEVSDGEPFIPPDGVIRYSYPETDKCPYCSGGRDSPSLTGCPEGSHYGSYCSIA